MSVEHVGNQESYQSSGTKASAAEPRASDDAMMQLQSLFASAMSQSLSGGISTGDSLFETIDTIQQTEDERREMQREIQGREDRRLDVSRDVSGTMMRKELDQSEIRAAQIKSEYADNFERRGEMQTEYQQKKQHSQDLLANQTSDASAWADRSSISGQETVLNFSSLTSTTLPNPASNNASASINTSSHAVDLSSQASLVVSQAVGSESLETAGALAVASHPLAFPQNIPQSGLIPNNAATATASVLTVFSLSGKLSAEKDKIEAEKTSGDKKKSQKKRPSSSFGAAVFEAIKAAEHENWTGNYGVRGQTQEPAETNSEAVSKEIDRKAKSKGIELGELFAEQNQHAGEQHSLEIERRSIQKIEDLLSATPIDSVRQTDHQNQSAGLPIPLTEQEQSTNIDPAERIQYLRRIVAACQSAAHRSGQVRIKIDLAELGVLTLRAKSQNNRLSVSFEATSPAAVRFLEKDLPVLKNSLAERNIALGEIEIELVN